MEENQRPNTPINESILYSIKKLLGITYDDTNFDTDIIININNVFTVLRQLGVGPVDGYRITDESDTWSDFIQNEALLDSVKTYVYLKVKMDFDPPLNSSLMESFERHMREIEWRLNVAVESEPSMSGGNNNE